MNVMIAFFHSETFIRLLFAMAFGFIIGIERELTNKSAGLRTHILVCMGSAVYTLLSIQGFVSGDHITRDPARIAAQIVTGIGFIGGGVVLRHGVSIYGLTTAASLWITASIGMAAGAGKYDIAFASSLLSFLVLVLMRSLERGILSKFTLKSIRVEINVLCTTDTCELVQSWFNDEFKDIFEYKLNKIGKENNESMSQLRYIIDIYDRDPLNKTYKKLKGLDNIEEITIKQVIGE
ncbi:MAG: MgtC/SapB family protein [bacterium]